MRFAITAILFIIAVFSFFIGYSIGSLLITSVGDALDPLGDDLTASSETSFDAISILISTAFGIICAIIVVMIIIIFVLDSLSDEPEEYWRG